MAERRPKSTQEWIDQEVRYHSAVEAIARALRERGEDTTEIARHPKNGVTLNITQEGDFVHGVRVGDEHIIKNDIWGGVSDDRASYSMLTDPILIRTSGGIFLTNAEEYEAGRFLTTAFLQLHKKRLTEEFLTALESKANALTPKQLPLAI